MKENKYDNPDFFTAYSQMSRSVNGLEGAGEWEMFKALLPDLNDKNILDVGCGFGWHCRYARAQGASSVIGVDLSEKMIEKAKSMTDDSKITYLQLAVEDIDFIEQQFDVVISSLTFHYIESFDRLCQKIYAYLNFGGSFVFSVEHPIFTSRPEQDWIYDNKGEPLYWPVDDYNIESVREAQFLGHKVTKYHRTLSTYINCLIQAGFTVNSVKETLPPNALTKDKIEMKDEVRRPMFLMISVTKNR
ncbi:class I SAM-dependent methyltransferase [Jeotgalicoccus meleagridis]|uniref:Trans-aconitate 2-methyltransferase n=1 Tax=Jeotgalicoccus meleagridis TaxID=2759181 RepID=A0A6V7R354_9STAP|nr:class I SAM-dependent methyltransferase [Jeotgalicoccus meleagridis]CAD2071799.1 Trans-aconitate 2-methyltransferase [Jeotgalicoccus meleagridis]